MISDEAQSMAMKEVPDGNGKPGGKGIPAWRKALDPGSLFLEEDIPEEEFMRRNRLIMVSAVVFMIAGPLFTYYGFYLLTWPYTVKWGALSIAVGLLILMFAFSMWQDRQIMTLHRLLKKEGAEIRRMLSEGESTGESRGDPDPEDESRRN
jgi:hypothetical protein